MSKHRKPVTLSRVIVRDVVALIVVAAVLVGVALLASGRAHAAIRPRPLGHHARHASLLIPCQPVVGDQEPTGFVFVHLTRLGTEYGDPFYVTAADAPTYWDALYPSLNGYVIHKYRQVGACVSPTFSRLGSPTVPLAR